jgi:ribonuclease BN (tRNA processing enzyme)
MMENIITFLGTAGARIMVANQIQASGGIWLSLNGIEILIDPGPGSIVQSTQRQLRADKLKAIILSHRHLDHSGDLNIMVEAMTQGGFQPGGKVFLPADALGREPVLYSYLQDYLDGVETLYEGGSYQIGSVTFSTPVRHKHSVETYGLRFNANEYSFSYIADGSFFEGQIEAYRADLIIINMVFINPRAGVAHLALEDAEKLVTGIKPKIAILNHFGLSVWKAHPPEVAEKLSQKTGVSVIAAHDGLKFDLGHFKETTTHESTR